MYDFDFTSGDHTEPMYVVNGSNGSFLTAYGPAIANAEETRLFAEFLKEDEEATISPLQGSVVVYSRMVGVLEVSAFTYDKCEGDHVHVAFDGKIVDEIPREGMVEFLDKMVLLLNLVGDGLSPAQASLN